MPSGLIMRREGGRSDVGFREDGGRAAHRETGVGRSGKNKVIEAKLNRLRL